MTTVATQVTTPTNRRKRALQDWMQKLLAEVTRHGPGDNPLELQLEGRSLHVSAWAVRQILDGDVTEKDGSPGRATVLVHALALRMKIAVDHARLQRASATEDRTLFAVQAELMLDSAMALAVKREIQQVVNHFVQAGEMAAAKRWSAVKNALHSESEAVRALLADCERDRATSLAGHMTHLPLDTVEQERRPGRPLPALPSGRVRRRLARVTRKAQQALSSLPSRRECLVVALTLATVVWLAFVKLPQQLSVRLPVVGPNDLVEIEGREAIVEIEARPPSVYLTVNAAAWGTLEQEERDNVLRSLAGVLNAKGYTGALLRTEAGRPVARWLALTGSSFIPDAESDGESARAVTPPDGA